MTKIELMGKARKLGIDGYRNMSVDELSAAIEAKEGKAPAKGKPAAAKAPAKGKPAPAKAATARTPAKGKTAPAKVPAKSAPAKSTAQKSTAKGKTAAAAQGAQAKRPTTGGTTAKGKSAPAKTTAAKTPAKGKTATPAKTPAKGKTAPTAKAKSTPKSEQPRTRRGAVVGRVSLGTIDWSVESNVGQSGKRKIVLDALRRHEGDKAKAKKLLAKKATTFYPGKSEDDALKALVWLIGRVAFDYALKTGQHEPGQRAGYGKSDKPSDVKRRELRAAAHAKPVRRSTRQASAPKATGAAQKGKTAPAKGKGAASPQKGAQSRTAATPVKGKPASTAKGKTTTAAKGKTSR